MLHSSSDKLTLTLPVLSWSILSTSDLLFENSTPYNSFLIASNAEMTSLIEGRLLTGIATQRRAKSTSRRMASSGASTA